MFVVSVVGCLFTLVSLVSGSSGDRSPEFTSCKDRCYIHNCSRGSYGDLQLGWDLRLLAWTCKDNCHYHCMHEATAQHVLKDRPIQQFYGKWPFVRVLGVQEVASALFSFLNGVGFSVGYWKFMQNSPKNYHLHPLLLFQFGVNINAMVWSTLFHARDLYWTEKMDYFSAFALIVMGIIVQFVRISGPGAIKWHVIYGGVWSLFLCCHITYLSVFKFDYGYNMMVCSASVVLYTGVWIVWCFKNRRERPYVWRWMMTLLFIGSFSLLELFDFPPFWWLVDAHSLWHLSTIPLGPLWYSFLTQDALYQVKHSMMKQA